MAVAGSITIDVSKLPKEEFYKGEEGCILHNELFHSKTISRFGKNISFS